MTFLVFLKIHVYKSHFCQIALSSYKYTQYRLLQINNVINSRQINNTSDIASKTWKNSHPNVKFDVDNVDIGKYEIKVKRTNI